MPKDWRIGPRMSILNELQWLTMSTNEYVCRAERHQIHRITWPLSSFQHFLHPNPPFHVSCVACVVWEGHAFMWSIFMCMCVFVCVLAWWFACIRFFCVLALLVGPGFGVFCVFCIPSKLIQTHVKHTASQHSHFRTYRLKHVSKKKICRLKFVYTIRAKARSACADCNTFSPIYRITNALRMF